MRQLYVRSPCRETGRKRLTVFSFLFTAFAHGANDLSNAIGPWAVIYHTWSTGQVAGKKTDVPIWMLVAGASMLVIGLVTYG